MSIELPDAAAERLRVEHGAKTRFAPLAIEQRQDMDFALAVQEISIQRWLGEGQRIAGWKIGLTSKAMQDFCKVSSPVMGAILNRGVGPSPARLASACFGRLGLEAELAVRLGRVPAPGEPHDARSLRACMDGVAAAFEVVDDRQADYATLDACSLVADNSWNAGAIFGATITLDDGEALLGRSARLTCDGATVGEGLTDDAGGDPLEVVSWLIDALYRRGRALSAGEWILTGSIVPTVFPLSGQTYRFEIDGFPPADVIVE